MTVTADITNYQDRIASGKTVEASIISQLREQGIMIQDPTPEEDMHKKIDGWITLEDGKKHSLQIKFRETGDDILFEIVKDWNQNIAGRDMISVAEYYLVVNREGVGKLFLTAPIKTLASMVHNYAKQAVMLNPSKTNWEFPRKWQAKVTVDRAHGNQKLMGYFNPNIFNTVKKWNFNL